VGLALMAYTVFAVAAGLAFAAVIGRTLPAMILTLAAFVGTRLLVELALRPRFLPPLSIAASLGGPGKTVFGSQVWTTGFSQNGLLAYFQPGSRFWLFQGIEAAIFLTLAAVLTGVAAWWLTHQSA
ncbi:MAG: hypothetical protein ACRDGI_02760, partial [Candidatus Limnocylindrales bacterium]